MADSDAVALSKLRLRVTELERRLKDRDRDLSALRQQYEKAMALLKTIARHKSIQNALDTAKLPPGRRGTGDAEETNAELQTRYQQALDVLKIVAESQQLLDVMERDSPSVPPPTQPRATRRSLIPDALGQPASQPPLTREESPPPTEEQVQRLTNSPGSYFVPTDDDEK